MSLARFEGAEDWILTQQEEETRPEEAPEPTCARCGGELVEVEGGQLSGPVGVFMLLIAAASWCLMPFFKVQLMLTGGAAAFILGIVLLRRKMWWVCTGCGKQFRRELPPRGFEDAALGREEQSPHGPLEGDEQN